MNYSEIKLPTNRKFGFFFSCIFLVFAIYGFYIGSITLAYVFGALALLTLLITLIKSEILFPANKLWIRVGVLLGRVVSPIVLGIMFFGMFTPVAIIMRLNKRDELRLIFSQKASHWITRSDPIKSDSFKLQF